MHDLVFSAIAEGRRRDILKLLRRGEKSSGEIAEHFDVSWPAISRHLRLLKEARLVHERREGRERLYTLNRARLRDVLGGWVAAFDAMWAESLDNLKHELESQPNSKERSHDPRR
ncbi:MAG: metalloregulator ArsR/SmtB family transcription factor [Gemmatimonadota bacterium]|nr:metalloregulator ArsR/SmtB family transcription factor [Gemmatimonadota bacterium]